MLIPSILGPLARIPDPAAPLGVRAVRLEWTDAGPQLIVTDGCIMVVVEFEPPPQSVQPAAPLQVPPHLFRAAARWARDTVTQTFDVAVSEKEGHVRVCVGDGESTVPAPQGYPDWRRIWAAHEPTQALVPTEEQRGQHVRTTLGISRLAKLLEVLEALGMDTIALDVPVAAPKALGTTGPLRFEARCRYATVPLRVRGLFVPLTVS